MKRMLLVLLIGLCSNGADGADTNDTGNILSLSLRAANAIAKVQPLPPREVLDGLAARLEKQFDSWLETPARYRHKALKECEIFPEGRIYPFVIPALAYANLAFKDSAKRPHSEAQMRKLIELAIPLVVQDVKPPDNDLLRMKTYQKQGTYLSSLNMVLASYECISKDERYRQLHARISKLLCDALHSLDGRPLCSYPKLTWNFDTVMALTSISIEDETRGLSRAAPLMRRHIEWLKRNATDLATGLPISFKNQPPRGCDISMQICLLAGWAPERAGLLYSNYTRANWVDLGIVSGFRETPKNEATKPYEVDIDSGPVILGIGMTATGMGIGAALAASDEPHLAKLTLELQALPELLPLIQLAEGCSGALFDGLVPFDSAMVTGFLYGDIMMFYSTTWSQPWKKQTAPGR